MVPVEILWLAAAIALVIVALAALVLAVAAARLAGDVRRLTVRTDRLLESLEAQLPPTLASTRELSGNLARLSSELAPRLGRVDELLEETQATLATLRSSLEATEDIVRGPADAVAGVQRTVRSLGEGLAQGAERILRRFDRDAGD